MKDGAMTIEALFAQITREAPSASRKETPCSLSVVSAGSFETRSEHPLGPTLYPVPQKVQRRQSR